MTKLYGLLLISILSQGIFAQITVNIRNPWLDSIRGCRDTLRVATNDTTHGSENWWPGIKMIPMGCGWFYLDFPSTRVGWGSLTVKPGTACGQYRYNIDIDSSFMRFSKKTKEIWIDIYDTTRLPRITDQPPSTPKNKYIYFLSPWDMGALYLLIDNTGSAHMRLDLTGLRCGWYMAPYFCAGGTPTRVKILNSFDSTYFSTVGLGNGAYIDITEVLRTKDTAWIYQGQDGAATVSGVFPGKTTPCNLTLLLSTTLRDYDSTHPDMGGFWEQGKNATKTGCWKQGDWGAPIPGMLQRQLNANGRPVLSATSPCPVTNFNWFTTETVPGTQYKNAMCYDLRMVKNSDGLFEYDTGFFFAADTFRYLDPNKTVANPRWDTGLDTNKFTHNFYYTLEVDAKFQYYKGQTFYFRGDDDVWVFINNRLVVDLGGIHNPMEGFVRLDTCKLTVGNTYNFNLFFCERNMPGSSFRMMTSLNLQTASSFFTIVRDSSSSIKIYDMKEKVLQTGLSCDAGAVAIDTIPAIMDFELLGPQFPIQPYYRLTTINSPHFDGITIKGDTTLILDTTALTGLMSGLYTIYCYTRNDHSLLYTIQFTIRALPDHHLDILVDAVPLDKTKDAKIDSIVIGMTQTDTEAYAVVRDSNQVWKGPANASVWAVRDPAIASVAKISGDRCFITKLKAGRTWLVVTQGSLKPDSTQLITYELPQYPVILSGVMQDTNADLVPDLLSLRLSDTFKINQRLDSVHITYKGQIITVPGSNVTVRGTQLGVPVPASVGVDGRPTGTATIYMTVDKESKSHSQAFIDGVCPAIIAADALENDGTSPDVLFLTFSEPLTIGSVVGRQLLLIPQGTTDTLALTITEIKSQANDSTFMVQTASSDRKAIAGDRLRLIPGSAGGTLTDKNANKPHDLNRSVVIGFRPGAAAIAAAWYLDMNADGILDNVVVKFKRKVEQAEVESAKIFRDPKQFVIAFSRCTRLDDSTYRIPIGDTLAQLNDINTQGAMDLTIVYNALPIPRVARVADSAAPVIKTARLVPGSLTQAGTRGKDTLTVSFSEEVVQPGQAPFLLSSKVGGLQYAFSLAYVGATAELYTYKFIIESINNPSVLNAMAGDTIWINPTAGVSDNLLTTQSNPRNRRVLLQVDWPQAQWNIEIWKNPFSSKDVIKEPFKTNDSTGTAIRAIPTTPVDLARVKSQIIIYDAVGNVLLSSAFKAINGTLRFCWNGTNNRGRLVASGAYLTLIKITDNGGSVFTKTVRIGIKR